MILMSLEKLYYLLCWTPKNAYLCSLNYWIFMFLIVYILWVYGQRGLLKVKSFVSEKWSHFSFFLQLCYFLILYCPHYVFYEIKVNKSEIIILCEIVSYHFLLYNSLMSDPNCTVKTTVLRMSLMSTLHPHPNSFYILDR